MSEKLFRIFANFLVVIMVARFLGPDQFGIINYLMAIINILGPITALGMAGVLVRDLVRNPEQQNELLGTSFVLKFLAALISSIGLVIFALFTKQIQCLCGLRWYFPCRFYLNRLKTSKCTTNQL